MRCPTDLDGAAPARALAAARWQSRDDVTVAIPETDIHRIQLWCRERVPKHLWPQVKVEADIEPRHVTIVEVRPPRNGVGAHKPIIAQRESRGLSRSSAITDGVLLPALDTTRKAWLIHIHDASIVYVNIAAPELAPLFRSDAQGEILARLLLNPDRAYSIAELGRATETSYASTHREVQRLIRAGLLEEHRVGRHHQLRADTASPAYRPLVDLLLLTYGPATVIPKVLADVPGIEETYIYGSWAARRTGEPGSPPGDVDVLVVGDPPRTAIYEAADEAERSLGRQVSIRIISAKTWAAATDPFIKTVQSRPLIAITLAGEDA